MRKIILVLLLTIVSLYAQSVEKSVFGKYQKAIEDKNEVIIPYRKYITDLNKILKFALLVNADNKKIKGIEFINTNLNFGLNKRKLVRFYEKKYDLVIRYEIRIYSNEKITSNLNRNNLRIEIFSKYEFGSLNTHSYLITDFKANGFNYKDSILSGSSRINLSAIYNDKGEPDIPDMKEYYLNSDFNNLKIKNIMKDIIEYLDLKK